MEVEMNADDEQRKKRITTETPEKQKKNCNENISKQKHRPQAYRKAWENQLNFKGWLTSVPSNALRAKCKACNAEITAELGVIKLHSMSKKHQIAIKTFQMTQNSLLQIIDNREENIMETKVKIAEMKLRTFLTEHNIDFDSANHHTRLLKSCFSDSEVVQKMDLGQTKMKHFTNSTTAKCFFNDLDWIQGVCNNPRAVLCKFCKCELILNKKDLEDHAKTAKHIKLAALEVIPSVKESNTNATIVNLATDIHLEPDITIYEIPVKDEIQPPIELFKPFSVPKKLLMGPDTSNFPLQVLMAMSQPPLGHFYSEFLQIIQEIKAGIQYAFQTNNILSFAINGSEYCATEAAICNILEPGEIGLFIVNGYWGEKAADIASRHGVRIVKINVPLGDVCDIEDIEKTVLQYKPSMLFICHGESSTGVLHPLENIGEMCHRHNCLLIVDAVTSLGAVPIYTDKWKIDVIYSSSQKVLSAPPGISPMSFSPRAV